MKKIAYSKSSLKALRKMPQQEALRIVTKVELFATDPTSLANNVTSLSGSPYIRLRIGDWRVIMDDRGTVLEVLKIGARGSIYRQETL